MFCTNKSEPVRVCVMGEAAFAVHAANIRVHGSKLPARLRQCARRKAPTMVRADGKHGVLMLCLGNICRSPAAEAVLKQIVTRRGVADKFDIDSCGTGGGSESWYMDGGFSWHEGDDADPRMIQAASSRGIQITSKSRPLQKDDFDRFDWIVTMDSNNTEAVETARAYWRVPRDKANVALLSSFSNDNDFKGRPVPDPYFGGQRGFEHALDLIEGACEGLVDRLVGEEGTA